MNNPDIIRLQHMLDSAREARTFTEGKSREDLDDNRMLVLALGKDIEIIGEAASKLSLEGRSEIAGIPWTEIIGMRNRLIHAYFEIDLDRLWDTLNDDLPQLITTLEIFLAR